MVGPAARREAVAHLQAELGLSERRACLVVSADRKMIRYRSRRAQDTDLGGNCETSPTPAGASAIGGCSCCCGNRASRPG
jgi:hypothetical protein